MNQSTLINRFLSQFLFLTIVLSAPVLLAGTETYEDPKDGKEIIPPQEIQPWCETPPPWEFQVALPGWGSKLTGDFGVKGIVAPLDISVDELLKHLEHMPIAVAAYARYHRWEIFGDGEWVQVHVGTVTPRQLLFTNADLHVGYAFWEGFVGYRLVNCDKAVLSLYAGARYNYYSGDFSIANNQDPRFPIIRQLLGIPQNGQVDASKDWFDPVVGLAGRIHLYKPVSFWIKGDVGGFDANSGSAFKLISQGRRRPEVVPASSSDWSYQIQGGLEFQVTRWLWSQVGWRYLKYDYKIAGFVNQTDLNGPFIQTGLNF
jgi:hypothetical protein